MKEKTKNFSAECTETAETTEKKKKKREERLMTEKPRPGRGRRRAQSKKEYVHPPGLFQFHLKLKHQANYLRDESHSGGASNNCWGGRACCPHVSSRHHR